MSEDMLGRIAQTVLYEGYVLWPYRRSAIKNQQRWTFGGVYPPAFAARHAGVDRARVRIECLLEASNGTRVDISLRFLHVIRRQCMQRDGEMRKAVDAITVRGERYLSWDETAERVVELSCIFGDGGFRDGAGMRVPVHINAGEAIEALHDDTGRIVGEIVRSWRALHGELVINASSVERKAGLHRIAVTLDNLSAWEGDERDDAVRESFISAHVVLRTSGGAFVSSVDPPAALADDVAECRNDGLWPMLVGDETRGDRDTVLAAPIILGDYPRIAAESPGDMFDGGEIDQLLILSILALTEDEQREMADSDPRARAILERCRTLSAEELARLHGTVRSSRAVGMPA